MPIVHFSHDLLTQTGGVEVIEIEAPRVHELVASLIARFPELQGLIDRMAVAVDGEIHQEADYVPLGPGSEVHFVPRLAGG